MQSIVLTVHLILAVLLIGVVLLQRSEGGGLGMGSGGGGGGVMTGRQAANALTRATWAISAAFIVTSIALTIIAARGAGSGSVLDRINDTSTSGSTIPAAPDLSGYAPPPGAGQPITPPSAGGTTTAPAPETTAPDTPAPETTAPATTAPETPAPATPAPAEPAVAPAPEAPAVPTPAEPAASAPAPAQPATN